MLGSNWGQGLRKRRGRRRRKPLSERARVHKQGAELSWSHLGTSTPRRLPTRVEANADDFVRRVLVERRGVSSGRPFLALIQRSHVVGPWTRTPCHEQQSQIRITDRAITVTGDRSRFCEDRIPVCPWFGTGDRAQGEKTDMPGTGWFS